MMLLVIRIKSVLSVLWHAHMKKVNPGAPYRMRVNLSDHSARSWHRAPKETM
jgi:hypothetical protein